MSERWLPIPGWPDYEVSDSGRIQSLKFGRTRLLKLVPTQYGYRKVGLCLKGKQTTRHVHYLVLLAFVGPRPDGLEILHADDDKANNALTNISYGTRAQNMAEMVAHGRHHLAGRTHCSEGHEYTEENTAPREDSGRRCRKCARAKERRRYWAKKEAS